MIRPALCLIPALLCACQVENNPSGTAVGNPTGLTFTPAPASDMGYTSASAKVETVVFEACDGATTPVTVGGEVDLLTGVDLEAPAGIWCAVVVPFGAPVAIVAEAQSGHVADLRLDVGQLRLANAGGFVVDTKPLLIELAEPDWLSAELVGADVEDVVVDAGPVHDLLVETIRQRSACFDDGDGDGALDATERDEGPYAVAVHDDDDGDDDTY